VYDIDIIRELDSGKIRKAGLARSAFQIRPLGGCHVKNSKAATQHGEEVTDTIAVFRRRNFVANISIHHTFQIKVDILYITPFGNHPSSVGFAVYFVSKF
jgi:hypothetical protein